MPDITRLKLELKRSAQPLAMLCFLMVLGGAAFGIIFRNLTFQRPWAGYHEVRAEFDDVKGIFPGGHQVRISGVKVGVVKKAQLVDGRAVLTLSIEDKWGEVYKDARIRIRPVTPLQDLYVNITDRGHPSAGVATEDDIISADRTETPVDISRVLNTFDGDTRKRMTILLSELGKGLADGGVQLRRTFSELAPFLRTAQRATHELAVRDRAVKRIVHNAGLLSGALAKRDDDLNRFVRRGNEVLGELAANDVPLDQTFSRLAALVPQMRSSFAELRALSGDLDPALRGLDPVAAKLESGLAGLQRFGQDARPAVRALRGAVSDVRPMARVLNPTARSLARAFAELRPQAPRLDALTKPVASCLKTGTIQDFFQNTISVFKYGDANGAFPRAEMTLDGDSGTYTPPLNLSPRTYCFDKTNGG